MFQVHDLDIKISKQDGANIWKKSDQYQTKMQVSKESNYGLRKYWSIKHFNKNSQAGNKLLVNDLEIKINELFEKILSQYLITVKVS